VLPSSDLILFDKKFEVTDEVLQRLDQQLPALTVSFATPATSETNPVAHARTSRVRRR
jgi:calcineurin-like phosphoesterase